MSSKPNTVLWHGFHPDTTDIGLRVVSRPGGELYGEEVSMIVTDPDVDPVMSRVPIKHVAAHAIRSLVEKVKKIEGETK